MRGNWPSSVLKGFGKKWVRCSLAWPDPIIAQGRYRILQAMTPPCDNRVWPRETNVEPLR